MTSPGGPDRGQPVFADHNAPLGVSDADAAIFDGEVVVFHQSASMVHRLNIAAGSVWLLCDGDTTVGAMATELGAIFAIDPSELAGDIQEALHQLTAAGLLVDLDADPDEPVGTATGDRTLTPPPDP